MAMVIKKDTRDAETAKLYVSGKDLRDQCYEIRYDKQRYIWEKLGTSQEVEAQRLREEYENNSTIKTIRKLVQQGDGHWEGTASDIIDASRYFAGCQIHEDDKRVGKLIRRFEQQLKDIDAITYRIDLGRGQARKLIFCTENPFLM